MGLISSYKKLTNWEHWSIYLFYIPLLPYAFYESLKSRHLCFFYSTNPGIFHSGNGTESKYDTLQIIPDQYKPKTILIEVNSNIEDILKKKGLHDIDYPMIAKPDIGYRGYLVKLIKNESDLVSYISKFGEIDFLLQEYISYKNECGIFYTKKPSAHKGKVTSITLKKLPFIVGDGSATLLELIESDDSLINYAEQFKNLNIAKLNDVIKKGEKFQLSVIGNHSKGTQFINGNHLIDDELVYAMDRVCGQIKGFNYGRLDIKYDNLEDLKKSKNFKILEVNGIMAEPTHVFDVTEKRSGYLNTLKEQIRHWGLLSEIARENHTINKVPYHPFSAFIKDLFWLKKHTKKLKALNKL